MYAVSAGLMWINPESRPNAVRLDSAAAVIGIAALDTDVFWAAGGYWLQLGWAIQPFYLPLMAAVLLSYPSSRVHLPRADDSWWARPGSGRRTA